MKAIFWNDVEDRPRSGWRILLAIAAVVLATWIVGLPLRAMGRGLGVAVASAAAGITLAVWGAGRWLDRRPFADFGIRLDRRWWTEFGFGLLLGVGMAGFVFAAELALGWIVVVDTTVDSSPRFDFATVFLGTTLLFVLVAWYEELLFRGYLIRNLAEGTRGRWGDRGAIVAAVVATAALFALVHVFNPNASVTSTLGILAAGLLLGLAYAWTGTLGVPIGLHVTWNLAQGGIFGLPVSGISTPARWIVVEERGPDAWTGGEFGPEAGLSGLVAMLLGAAATFAWVRARRGKVSIQCSLAEPPERD